MTRLILALSMLAALAGEAWAQSPTKVVPQVQSGTQSSGTPIFSDVSSSNPLPITGNVGGFDSGPVQATGTTNSSSHAAGSSLGGLITLPVARTSGGSGGISQITYKSGKGSTGQVLIRVWAHNPTNTTCTDQTAFVGSTTDDAYLLTTPFPLTPAAPAVTTGDALTYATYLPGRLSFVTSGNTNIYACVLTVATDTTDESGTVYVTVGGDLN